MPSAYFSFGNSRIHYSYWGTGRRLLLCFHGYGESAASFAFLGEALGEDFTILAIDLPYHGQTEWNDGLYLSPHDLLNILQQIAMQFPVDRETWWCLGYSMGGRVALQLFELAPDRISRLVLLATDGLQMNFWYWLATQTTAGNKLFHWTMKRPGWLFFLLRTGHLLRVVNPSIYKFTAHYVDDAQVRENLYARWTTMRGFRPDPAAIGRFIRQYETPVRLLYGNYDRIIRWERGEQFCRPNAVYCSLTLLPAGHQLLQPRFLEVIAKALYLPPDGPEARRS
jgi:pimeloyl-ACP methyl ester carboxylesterase